MLLARNCPRLDQIIGYHSHLRLMFPSLACSGPRLDWIDYREGHWQSHLHKFTVNYMLTLRSTMRESVLFLKIFKCHFILKICDLQNCVLLSVLLHFSHSVSFLLYSFLFLNFLFGMAN